MTENTLSTRLATENDYEEVMLFSKGQYGGNDYLPYTYHEWLVNTSFIVLVGVFEEKVIGYVALHIVDDCKTVVHKALRIDGNYRSKGFGSQLTNDANTYARRKYPTIVRSRSTSAAGDYGIASQKLNEKDGKTVILRKVFAKRNITINDQLRGAIQMHTTTTAGIFKCSKEVAAAHLFNNKSNLFPNNVHVVGWQPYEAVASNIDQMFHENDNFVLSLSPGEEREKTQIQSFSHARLSNRNRPSLDIILYADEITLVRDHVLYQLNEVVTSVDDLYLSICCSEDSKMMVDFILSNELALTDDIVEKTGPPGFIVYEKGF